MAQITKILRLEHSRSERAFESNESLWDDEISRMEGLIDNHLNALKISAEKDKNLSTKEMPRLSIGIFGYPGSGKSSLLETFVKHANDNMLNLLNQTHSMSGVYSLPVIKPNLLAKDEHFIYKFLATTLDEDKKKRQRQDSLYRDSSILSQLQQVFQEVSEYLQVIDETSGRQEDDPMGVSLDRLERQESGVKLAEKMDEFIDELARSLTGSSKSLIFMPVDDADLSMDTLISAVSTCWRYLQHPRLIPIFTFTGRLAEELLRVHFEKKLTIKGSTQEQEKLKEASTSLLMTQNMALQYLGKLFPVRNRIRMGHASSRVLGANYSVKGKEGGLPVDELLKAVSRLLFGHARVPIVPEIRPPLRMVSLRRQVQIVDAMQASGIEQFMPPSEEEAKQVSGNEQGNSDKGKSGKTWGQLFDLATWTLLNTHRDVLKEYELNLDDLYGWTPKGLRQVVLDSILEMDWGDRVKILKHWRYRTEDRRSQILSLLAANVFRPTMFGEEPTNDEPDAIRNWQERKDISEAPPAIRDSFSVAKGIRWFINLCIGFYVPQVLSCNRYNAKSITAPGEGGAYSISGIGWDTSSGPIHAMREALNNRKIFSTGMLFLDPVKYKKTFEETNSVELKMFLGIWCFHGFKEGFPWAAVSLWRGLGLIAQLIKSAVPGYKETGIQGKEKKEKIKSILKKHLKSGLVLGNLPIGFVLPGSTPNVELTERMKFTFPDSSENAPDNAINSMVKRLTKWLKELDSSKRISPMTPGKEENPGIDNNWKGCFIRRLHGENIASIFWQDLENCFYQKSLTEWNIKSILSNWFSILWNYWSDCEIEGSRRNAPGSVGDILMKCPLLGFAQDKDEKDVKEWTKEEFKELEDITIESPVPHSIFAETTPEEKKK